MTRLLKIIVVLAVLALIPAAARAADEPVDAEAAKHLEQGLSLLKAKDLDGAIHELEKSAEMFPDAETYYLLGYAYYLKGRSGDEASRSRSRENFEKAYEIDPNFTPTKLKPAETVPSAPAQKQDGRKKSLSEAAPRP